MVNLLPIQYHQVAIIKYGGFVKKVMNGKLALEKEQDLIILLDVQNAQTSHRSLKYASLQN